MPLCVGKGINEIPVRSSSFGNIYLGLDTPVCIRHAEVLPSLTLMLCFAGDIQSLISILIDEHLYRIFCEGGGAFSKIWLSFFAHSCALP